MGDNGQRAEICQGECQVDAASTLAAVEQGKRAFRDQARIPHWSLHADRISVAETEFPSQTSRGFYFFKNLRRPLLFRL
jgi:hypothetical protein